MRNKLFFVLIALLLITPVFAQQNNEEEFIPEEEPSPEIEEIRPQPAAPVTAATQPAGPAEITISKIDRNKISLDIKGMDVVDVLKMLSQRSGMNIVIGKNVAGRVTLFLKDVDIADAFEIIILANDLAYERKGEIINVMTQRDYELLYGGRYQDKKQAKVIKLKYAKAADLSRALNQIKTNLGRIVVDEGSNTLVLIDTPDKIKEMEDFIKRTDLPIQTRVFSLNYAQADKIQPKIQESLTKGVGYIRIDERSNKIAITDYPEKLDEIARVIAAFDEKTPQVLIDAQIIEIKPSDQFQMGVDWDVWFNKNFRFANSLPLGTSNKLSLGLAAANLALGEKYDKKGMIDLLRTIGNVKILSSPRIMVINNQEAKILVGTKDAYITSSTSQAGEATVTSQSVNFVDTGIKLYVTPTVNRDGFVTMKIRPEISSAEPKTILSEDKKTDVPIVTTSEAETTVMVKDGVTLIIGGLRKDKRTKTVKKIPVLGDIPGLGFFFRSTDDKSEKNELVILLTPHIMSGETTYSDFSEIKPMDGAIARMDKGNIVINKVKAPPKEIPARETSLEYYKSVGDKVRAYVLFERSKSEKGEIKLAFTLAQDGTLISEPYILETNNEKLKTPAIKAIKEASPFPPFPKSLEKTQETFKISLSYE